MLNSRLSTISYIPQGAMNSLNPVLKIKRQMVDAYNAHNNDRNIEIIMSLAREAITSVELGEHVLRCTPMNFQEG